MYLKIQRSHRATILEPTRSHPEVVHIESQLLSQSWPPPKHQCGGVLDGENPLEMVKKPQNLTWIYRIYIYTKKKMWFKKVIPMEHDSCYDYSILRCLNALLCHVNQISAKNEISGALPPCASLLCFKAFHDRVSVSTKWSLQDLFQHNQLPCRRTKAPISPNATFLCLQKTYKNRLMFFYLATCYLEKKKGQLFSANPHLPTTLLVHCASSSQLPSLNSA